MIEQSDIVEVPLTLEDLNLAYFYAKSAEIGGRSSIRSAEDRKANLSIDQFVGVGIGELVGNKYFFTIEHYKKNRDARNRKRFSGDKGSDTPGYLIDFKGSNAKNNPNLLTYRLAVRPCERHKGCIYVLVLAKFWEQTPEEIITGIGYPPKVYLVGWAYENQLPTETEGKGIFAGAFTMGAFELNTIADLTIDKITTIDQDDAE